MNIIAVDDEKHALINVLNELSLINLVTQATGFMKPQDALEFIKENTVDVALLDVKMRGMSGLELAYIIKNISPATFIIFATGYKQYAYEAFKLKACGYILKPVTADELVIELEGLKGTLPGTDKCRIRVQTFGNFEVFVEDKPVVFSRSKSKELLAYLVDRQGACVKKAELAGVLWEEKEYTRSLQQQLQAIISETLKALKGVGALHMIIRQFNSLSVDTGQFECDSYSFQNWDISSVNAYKGEYMSQYHWAEFKLGYLEQHYQRMSGAAEKVDY